MEALHARHEEDLRIIAHHKEEGEILQHELERVRLEYENLERRRDAETLERSESRAMMFEEREEREALQVNLKIQSVISWLEPPLMLKSRRRSTSTSARRSRQCLAR
ncbi:MAG TPA: hypothetical protein VGO47_00375 [Chlamydiales bacterium]|nr:hypothetical protein [Chlamydiales bacterium]